MSTKCAEEQRLEEYHQRKANWKLWGPYVSDRAWGTVREDYSEHGNAWEFLPHDHSRSKAYRWGEDGIAGISDREQFLCFAPSFWNEKDPILKERLFGLTHQEGNHGEDVKECYYYLDSTPSHSYMKMLYKYPQQEFPYLKLVEENRRRSKQEQEYELIDTNIFNENRYFDCFVEYAKESQDNILIKITAYNRGPSPAPLHIIPTAWFRNTWSWGYPAGPMSHVAGVPHMSLKDNLESSVCIKCNHPSLGTYFLYGLSPAVILFTNNETNTDRLYQLPNRHSAFVKDAFHTYFIDKNLDAIDPAMTGTKVGLDYFAVIKPGAALEIRLRLCTNESEAPFANFDQTFALRQQEANEFYDKTQNTRMSSDEKLVQRQAFAGLLWSKQLYYYDLEQWLSGDPIAPRHVETLSNIRNKDWIHLTNFDIISMPDKWEYPWYAAWDLAFHAVALALVDADFAKRQLELMTREWYMHPNGQLPAYEWALGDVNPPVHAWATWRVYKIDAKKTGKPDLDFLEGVFHKLLLNFTWWVNRKDADGLNIFQGGFLGLDNIGVFDRSAPIPQGGHLDQADGTSWMAHYSLIMLVISLELATKRSSVYQDISSKFMEHFLRIANAMSHIGGGSNSLWDEEDGFFYDILHLPNGSMIPLKVRSLVGLIPLFASETIEQITLKALPDFHRRLKWFVSNRQHLSGHMARVDIPGVGKRRLLSILTKNKLVRVFKRMFDPEEFLSPYGIRSLSRYHEKNPYQIKLGDTTYMVDYQPGDSTTNLFGGNSNWRGPIWFPINFLIIESLQRFHHYYGDEFKIEYPTGSGKKLTLNEIATDLSHRLASLFTKNSSGQRPTLGSNKLIQDDPNWKDHLLFYEYFNPETGQGLGASHQTGWTALVAKLLQQSGGLDLEGLFD